MEEKTYYENYPVWIICSCFLITILSYALGAIIFFLLNNTLGWVYIIICLAAIIFGMKLRCCHCYYYGKNCALALGKMAKIFFKPGDPNQFKDPKKLLPEAILSFGSLLLPVIGGIILVIIKFSLLTIVLLAAYIIIAGFGGFASRKNLYCKHCKQGQLGCPAYEGMKKK